MTLSVSSWFAAEAAGPTWSPARHFTLGGSDASAAVLRWPALRTQLGGVDLMTAQIALSNADGRFNSFVSSTGAVLATSCELALSLTHPGSGEERLRLFQGQTSRLRFQQAGAVLALELQGRTRQLGNPTLGSDATSGALLFTTSAMFPSDLSWDLLTQHGGLDSAQNCGNADIDYAGWLAWRHWDEMRDIRVQARFRGERLLQALDDLTLMASRGLSLRDGRLSFPDRYEGYEGPLTALDPGRLLNLEMDLDPARLVNVFQVEADYSLVEEAFLGTVSRVQSDSIVLYGERAGRFSSTAVWFASIADAHYLAEDQVLFNHRPTPRLHLRLPLDQGLGISPGQTVTLSQSYIPVSSSAWRVQAQTLDLEQGESALTLERAWRRPWQL